MQLSRAKEQLSFAYITAVASQARVQVEFRRLDEDGIDGVLIWDEGTEPRIDFQAKSMTADVTDSDHVAYDLNVKSYNRLVKPTTDPRILIVMVLPRSIDDWVHQNDERMLTRYSAYWLSMRGWSPTDNVETERVQLPKNNILTSKAIEDLVLLADSGGFDND